MAGHAQYPAEHGSFADCIAFFSHRRIVTIISPEANIIQLILANGTPHWDLACSSSIVVLVEGLQIICVLNQGELIYVT